ncbi:ABC transporter ATP-binding protein [Hazenella coriacea]|uniref:ABC-2 type transport system ATP-binding protein n=1 Tax=Hazenella coriacea TaxID=1179467 RepID=A0A4R3L659_9BACL|nr:ABC transporter ATP-binding protein [Hazenella coriacea]TCS93674.1 ABC-2 type transport system ATP-binding protein [Hazenella coriacea]
MAKPVLELRGTTKKIRQKTLVDHIDLKVYPGEVFGFLGPNGAGKTTTIRMIMGLMSISEGEVYIEGKSVKQSFEKAIQHVGGIVENPEMYKFLSGYHNLLHFARMSRIFSSKKEMNERIQEVTALMGLENRIHDKVKRYSLGMRQRLGLAQALLHRPSLLILDEPTNGLDPSGIRELRDYLRKLAHEENMAVFVSSHLLSEMELMCDRIGIIQSGKLIDVRTIKDFVSEDHEDVVHVRFIVKELEKAKEAVLQKVDKQSVKIIEEALAMNLSEEKIPEINEWLVKQGIKVYGIEKKAKSLEEKFLEITAGKKIV